MLKKASSRGPVAPAVATGRSSTHCMWDPLHADKQWVELQRVNASSQAAAALDDLFEHPVTYSVGVLHFLGPAVQGYTNGFSPAC